MGTLTTNHQMTKPDDAATSWGNDIRNAMDTLDYLAQRQNCYHVDPSYTVGNLYPGGDYASRRHFHTIQAAIDAAELAGTNQFTQIHVSPAQYNENLVVTKTMSIIGVGPPSGMGRLSGGSLPKLVGATGSPTVKFQPGASATEDFTLANFVLDNAHTGTGGTITTWPYLFESVNQTPGLYGTRPLQVTLSNIHYADGSTTQQFSNAIKSVGWYNFNMDGCSFRFPHSSVTGFTYPLYMAGNESGGSYAHLMRSRNCHFYHDGTGNATAYLADNSSINSAFSSHLRTSNWVHDNNVGVPDSDWHTAAQLAASYNAIGSQHVYAY